jgi:hypothetical protein
VNFGPVLYGLSTCKTGPSILLRKIVLCRQISPVAAQDLSY